MAESKARHPVDSEPESGQIDEFFKAILASKALRSDEKKEIEIIARQSVEHSSLLQELQGIAAQHARKIYKCTVCGLEFIGILSFTEHNEATAHMKDSSGAW